MSSYSNSTYSCPADEEGAEVNKLLLEREQFRNVLVEIGRLCRWTGGGMEFSGQPLADMREIRRIVEAATGLSFEEYT